MLPWANASWTSPPTPAKESWGPWVGVWPVGAEPDEGERPGIGTERGEAWLGEEPEAWAWERDEYYLLHMIHLLNVSVRA